VDKSLQLEFDILRAIVNGAENLASGCLANKNISGNVGHVMALHRIEGELSRAYSKITDIENIMIKKEQSNELNSKP